jgi:hypothetical protein
MASSRQVRMKSGQARNGEPRTDVPEDGPQLWRKPKSGSMIPRWSGSSGGTAGSADAAECD